MLMGNSWLRVASNPMALFEANAKIMGVWIDAMTPQAPGPEQRAMDRSQAFVSAMAAQYRRNMDAVAETTDILDSIGISPWYRMPAPAKAAYGVMMDGFDRLNRRPDGTLRTLSRR